MPKNVPLRIPPGIARPGTVYDTRGRWYDASLVRWHEGAMGPVGGWQPAERNDDVAVTAAISDDGGVMTDETADANDADTNDVVLVPASPASNDAFYIGYGFRFNEITINVSTAASDGGVTWEYYDGSAWVALSGVVDNTDNFQNAADDLTVVWDLPWDWEATTVNTQGPYYYVRARVTTVGTSTALGKQCFIGDGPLEVDEVIRGMLAWKANDQIPHLAFGTPTYLYVYNSGTLRDITPDSFTTGGGDATLSTGNYGDGAYGSGAYGVGNPALQTIVETQVWQLDSYGEDLVAQAYSDGKLYTWDKSDAGIAEQIENSPIGCRGVVVTPERFIVALGPSGDLPVGASGDRRELVWSDQQNMTLWDPADTNQAGSFVLPGPGELMAGRRSRAETLIWTDVDLFAMRYVGGTLVYSFQQVGSQCGAISRMSMVVVDSKAFWMSHSKFFMYDGFVTEIPNDVADYVFNDINRTQSSKAVAVSLAEKNTVRWYYCSGGSVENDRYVEFNWEEQYWNIGALQRTAGVDRNAFDYPMASDASGVVYDQERGSEYLDQSGSALTPYAESGPIEIAEGDNVMHIVGLIPDEKTLGDVQMKLYTSFYPTADETLSAAFTAREPTNVRLTARQVRMRLDQQTVNWRFGTPRLQIEQGGRR